MGFGAKGLAWGFGAKGLTCGEELGFAVAKILVPADGPDEVAKSNFDGAGVVVGVVEDAKIDFGFSAAGVEESNTDLGFSTAGVADSKMDFAFSTAGVVASILSSLTSAAGVDLAASLRESPKPPPNMPPPVFLSGSFSFAVFGSALNVVPSTKGLPKVEPP